MDQRLDKQPVWVYKLKRAGTGPMHKLGIARRGSILHYAPVLKSRTDFTVKGPALAGWTELTEFEYKE